MTCVIRLLAALCCALIGFQAAFAHVEKRVALVIGNSAYQFTRSLPNPKNDAEAIAKSLQDIGFMDVTLQIDLDYRAMRSGVRAFAEKARDADIALVYFAGHGLEVGGENYLVPVDAQLVRDGDLEYEAITLESVLQAVAGARKLKVIVLDACRNNPFAEKILLRSGATRSVSRGLARIEPKGEALIAYAARAGTLAKDGRGRHSPYAEALLQHMATPGLDIIRMFGRVKEAVLKATNDEQEPWLYGSPGGDIMTLVPGKGESERDAADNVEWIRATAANRLDAYRAYIKAFPTGAFSGQALLRIAALRQLAVRWEMLKVSKDLPNLRSFADDAKASEFGPLAAIRLKELEAIEAAAWHDAEKKQRLAGYEAFLATWPQGFFAVAAREKMAELEAIRNLWLKIKESEDETVIEAFVFQHGWSEYGAEATANLVALRRARARPDSSGIKTLVADEMLRLIDDAVIVFQGSGEAIHFATQSMPPWRPRLGKNFLKQMLKEDLAAEGAFASKVLDWSKARASEGLGAVVRSKVDKTGSLFLLQLDGSERSGKDVDSKDRQFKTLQIVSDSFGYVCIATGWHSILANTKPLRMPERCTINKKR